MPWGNVVESDRSKNGRKGLVNKKKQVWRDVGVKEKGPKFCGGKSS